MFSKALLAAVLSLSLAGTFAAPASDFHPPSNQNNQEQCATAITTVTVTASGAAATLASKGGNNASGSGAAGNNNNNDQSSGNGSAAASAAAASAAAASAAAASAVAASAAATSAAAATAAQGTAAASASAAAATASSSSSSSTDSGDVQSSLTLDPSVLATGFENNGQAVQEAGQVASLTSSNNFINFCATVPNLPITNGQQVTTGSCNPAPMGIIAATTNMPSAKFVFPANGATVQANTNFTITMAISNLETGNFVNADSNFFAAPQQVNTAGDIVGHSHVVVEAIESLDSTTPTDPTTFAFFKGLNAAAVNGQLTAAVAGGLPAGTYRLASINTAANHQPVLVAIAQHGALDDMVYFTVTADGQPAAAAGNSTATAAAGNNAAAATAAAGTAATASAATSASQAASSLGAFKGGKGGKRAWGPLRLRSAN